MAGRFGISGAYDVSLSFILSQTKKPVIVAITGFLSGFLKMLDEV
jgi:hypothetical protein